MKNKIAAMVTAAFVLLGTVFVSPASAQTQTPFNDVPNGVYYTQPVAWIADIGITVGTGGGTYSPGAPVTRAQMATFLWRSVGRPNPTGSNPFVDVPAGQYYTDAVRWLAQTGITTGTGANTYSPNDPVTRAQMATFLWRSVGQPSTAGGNPFVDVPNGQFYTDAVRWLAATGITTGTGPNTYSPANIVTRAQMATFLWRSAGQPSLPPTNLCSAQNLRNYVTSTFWYAAPVLQSYNCSLGHLFVTWRDASGLNHETLVRYANPGWRLVASANRSLGQTLNLTGAGITAGQVNSMRSNTVAV